ncbi:protein of unknown function [Faunimonas pinastri]|uniref:DUF1963 domain-containing protein n=2 Tax=Faunimonas pinastri TaxID=1855383 RepID=A0A1H9D7E0_9HYPH|nr:protein of unknown function [Faunimonas pinastri]
MPDHAVWPCGPSTDHPDRGETPLHFLAQIACADLPAELWGGLGPREGWLLLFLNGQESFIEDNNKAVHVLPIEELGPEREPPPGTLPVADETFSGPDYGFVRSQNDIPTRWRRWPVDLVTIPSRSVEGSTERTIIPEDFAGTLYDGAPARPATTDWMRTELAPFSWRGVLYVLDSIERKLAENLLPMTKQDRIHMKRPGWIGEATASLDQALARLRGQAEQSPNRPQHEERISDLESARRFLGETGDAVAVQNAMKASQDAHLAWRQDARQRLAALRKWVSSRDLDSPLPSAEWAELRQKLVDDRSPYWFLMGARIGVGTPRRLNGSLLDLARHGLAAAQTQIAADYYTSPKLRDLIPADLLRELEPDWRTLDGNRPHRMGGTPDVIQPARGDEISGELLLFQVASDGAMHWTPGDVGALYVFIDPARLARNDFSELRVTLETY